MTLLACLFALVALASAVLVARPWLRTRLPARGEADAPVGVAVSPAADGEPDAQALADAPGLPGAGLLREEMRRRLQREQRDAQASAPAPRSRPRVLVGIALSLLPVLLAAIWYLQSGSWRTLEALAAAKVENPGPAEVARIVEGLREQLVRTPDDAERWALLAQGYESQGRDADAAEAWGHANRLASPPQPDWLVSEGEDYARAHEHHLAGLPSERFTAALAVAPDHARALWYDGMAALQAHDLVKARTDWERLGRQDLPPEARTALASALARVGGHLGAVAAAPATPAVTLHLSVALAPGLAGRVRPGDTLFVFARAPSGPPMPLAVRRMPAELPAQLTLDDSMAPMAGPGLGAFPAWDITARVSRSGTAQPEPGDLEGHAHIERAQLSATTQVTIADVVAGAPPP